MQKGGDENGREESDKSNDTAGGGPIHWSLDAFLGKKVSDTQLSVITAILGDPKQQQHRGLWPKVPETDPNEPRPLGQRIMQDMLEGGVTISAPIVFPWILLPDWVDGPVPIDEVHRPPDLGTREWWWDGDPERRAKETGGRDISYDDYRWEICRNQPNLSHLYYSNEELGSWIVPLGQTIEEAEREWQQSKNKGEGG